MSLNLMFQLEAAYQPAADQPQAIQKLVAAIKKGARHQVLLGVTGSGKTYTMANVVAKLQRPTLVISHNKTLAAQLAQEYRDFFPKNAVEYFVSYYDYYQPEAYIPQRDQYIEKEADINQEIDRLRLSTTASLLSREDVLVVASVSCIYNLGSPLEYGRAVLKLEAPSGGSAGRALSRNEVLRTLVDLFYERSDFDFRRSSFRVRGPLIDLWPAYDLNALRVEFDATDTIKYISKISPLSGEKIEALARAVVFPAKHYVSRRETYERVFKEIRADLKERVVELRKEGKILEAHRLSQRTDYDLETIRTLGYCNGIENYSRYFEARLPGQPPYTLLDYFAQKKDWLLIIDESHITVPQIRGMYNGDRARKETLVAYGFRLPSALDNRPLRFDEFLRKISSVVYTSATPGEWEVAQAAEAAFKLKSQNSKVKINGGGVVEQLVRPTGLLDPEIEIRPIAGQIEDLISEIERRRDKRERTLVTTLTKRLAEELTEFLKERGLKVNYLDSDIETLERSDILDDLRRGNYDVLVGINLLREGLDLPEVSLVAILDADKEGFLRSETSLIQTMGRAARHLNGRVIMYADVVTSSMAAAIKEVERRRKYQLRYNQKNKITPKGISKGIRSRLIEKEKEDTSKMTFNLEQILSLKPADIKKALKDLETGMKEAAEYLDFELAAQYRDLITKIKKSALV